LNLNKNAGISIFLKTRRKDILSQISLEVAFTYRKANTYKKLHGKWQHKKKHFWYLFYNKIVATVLSRAFL